MRGWWAVALLLAACGTGRVAPERLRISAEDGRREARTQAVTWATDARLRWVQGDSVTPSGYVQPPTGSWRFVYEAPERGDQAVVTVTPRTIERGVRQAQGPPGFVLGAAPLPESWIDSPAALAAAKEAGAAAWLERPGAVVTMLLLPLSPAQWVVRIAAGGESGQWRVHAQTGEVIGR